MTSTLQTTSEPAGILLIDKPRGQTAFSLVRLLRRHLGVRKIGHAGTLDPFATGVMVMLIGKRYTTLSNTFLNADKEYIGRIMLGVATDTYDCEGQEMSRSDIIPSREEVDAIVARFQGTVSQVPPMFSAKKQNGKKLYELARKGIEVERPPVAVTLETKVLYYSYPILDIQVKCSKGTYIRSIAHDMGQQLGCGGHLTSLQRTRSGSYLLSECFDGERLLSPTLPLQDLHDKLILK